MWPTLQNLYLNDNNLSGTLPSVSMSPCRCLMAAIALANLLLDNCVHAELGRPRGTAKPSPASS